jgi:hypothetical protein
LREDNVTLLPVQSIAKSTGDALGSEGIAIVS